MLKKCLVQFGRSERGLYFPINHRIVDQRVAPSVVTGEADVQSRYRRELRTSFVTGETRQTVAPSWSAKARPTHFLSLPLPPKTALLARVREMHNAMIFANQASGQLLVPLPKLHVTLGVMTVEEEKASATLKQIQDCVDQACHDVCKGPLQLRFRGLGTFGQGRVLFARCVTEGQYTTLDALVRRVRKDVGMGLGVDIKGNPYDSYVPHVTVAKIRHSQRKEFGRQIPMSMWAEYQHNDFGDVSFSKVDLCSMKGDGEGGYYKVISSRSVV